MTKKKKLAIMCASYGQWPIVSKANEMGIETHCFAWDKGDYSVCKAIADYYHPISIIEKEQILEVCRDVQIDGITTIADEVSIPTICHVAKDMGLIANGEDALVAINKYQSRQRFLAKGVSSPRFVIASPGMDVSGFRYPLIVKPTDRCGSRGVMKVEKPEDLQYAIERARQDSFSRQAIVEEFVSGSEVSVESISWKGQHYILTITDKTTTGAPYFVELAHHQPSQLSAGNQEKIRAETLKALTALNIEYGASHAELKVTEDGEVYVIEVGPRMGGDQIGAYLVELSTSYDYLKGVVDVALGQFVPPVIDKNRQMYSGIYYLCKETEQLKSIIENKDKDPRIVKTAMTSVELRHIQTSVDRSGFFIYQAKEKMTV
jgi:biotin carboxylase